MKSGDALRCLGLALLTVLYLFSSPASARMYQWLNPDTGTTQLSGTPPSWYRGTATGPRVYVIENGQVIDDTAIEVSNSNRRKLREQAFLLANRLTREEQQRQEKLRKAVERASTVTEDTGESPMPDSDFSASADAQGEQETIESRITTPSSPQEAMPEEAEDPAIQAMKALIAEWENRRTEQARRALLESGQ